MDANFRTGEQRGGLRSMHTGEGGKKWGQTCACLDLHILSVQVKLSLSLTAFESCRRQLSSQRIHGSNHIYIAAATLWIRRTQKQLRGRNNNPAAYSDLGAYI